MVNYNFLAQAAYNELTATFVEIVHCFNYKFLAYYTKKSNNGDENK